MFPVGCLRLALDIVVPPPGTTIGPATAGATLDVSVWNLDPLHHDVQVEIECVTGLLRLSGSHVLTLPANAVPTSVPGGPPGAVIQFSLVHAGNGGGTETLMCRSVVHRPTSNPGWYRPVTPSSNHTATATVV